MLRSKDTVRRISGVSQSWRRIGRLRWKDLQKTEVFEPGIKEWRGDGRCDWWVKGTNGKSATRRTRWVRIGEIAERSRGYDHWEIPSIIILCFHIVKRDRNNDFMHKCSNNWLPGPSKRSWRKCLFNVIDPSMSFASIKIFNSLLARFSLNSPKPPQSWRQWLYKEAQANAYIAYFLHITLINNDNWIPAPIKLKNAS